MRLRNGSQHESQTNDPGQYSISTFSDTDLPVQIGTQSNTRKSRSETPLLAMSNRALLEKSKGPGGKWYLIELSKRFAYPSACLVLMLIGVPLGVSSKRGGKSAGFVLTIALVFLYYFLSSTGVALGRQNKLPVFIGVWMANFVFAFCGLLLLRQMATGGRLITMFSSLYSRGKEASSEKVAAAPATSSLSRRHRAEKSRFPLILDDYVLREFITTFGLVLISFVLLLLVFTFLNC